MKTHLGETAVMVAGAGWWAFIIWGAARAIA